MEEEEKVKRMARRVIVVVVLLAYVLVAGSLMWYGMGGYHTAYTSLAAVLTGAACEATLAIMGIVMVGLLAFVWDGIRYLWRM
jgi:hypothetical protein